MFLSQTPLLMAVCHDRSRLVSRHLGVVTSLWHRCHSDKSLSSRENDEAVSGHIAWPGACVHPLCNDVLRQPMSTVPRALTSTLILYRTFPSSAAGYADAWQRDVNPASFVRAAAMIFADRFESFPPR